jgi:guanylate kinase
MKGRFFMVAEAFSISTQDVITLLATALTGVSLYVVRKALHEVDELKKEMVRKDELDRLEERMTQARTEMHQENQQKLTGIQSAVNYAMSRLDELMLELARRGG